MLNGLTRPCEVPAPKQDISQYFDHVFYSHEIGHRKPENGAWQIIIEQEGIDPQKTLFIDDKEENIEALTH